MRLSRRWKGLSVWAVVSMAVPAVAWLIWLPSKGSWLFTPTMVLVVISFMVPGYALLTYLPVVRSPLLVLMLAPAASYALFGAVMLLIVVVDLSRVIVPMLHWGLVAVSFVVLVRHRHRIPRDASLVWPVAGTLLLFASAAYLLTMPATAKDIPGILSPDIHHTRVPGLPGDSYLPYRTAQFVIHGLDIEREPYYFGHLISERTPWMGLVSAYWLLAIDADVPVIISTAGSFWAFEILGTFLNSLAIIPGIVLTHLLYPRVRTAVATASLLVLPFVYVHTVYTRPGNLVAYLTLSSFALLVLYRTSPRRELVVLSGLLSGLAYLAHPFGVMYGVGAGLYLGLVALRKRTVLDVFLWAAIVLVLTVPWELWTRFVYNHPSVFYDYASTYGGTGLTEKLSLMELALSRTVVGYYPLISVPVIMEALRSDPAAIRILISHYLFSLPGALTTVGAIASYLTLVRWAWTHLLEVCCLVLVPMPIVLLVYPASVGLTTFALHPIVIFLAVFLALAVTYLRRWGWLLLASCFVEFMVVQLGFMYPLGLVLVQPRTATLVAAWFSAIALMIWWARSPDTATRPAPVPSEYVAAGELHA